MSQTSQGPRLAAQLLAALVAASACGPAAPPANDTAARPSIAVKDARARRVPASDRGVLYLTVRNDGPNSDRLERIVTKVATAELHETVDDDGVLRMVHRAEGFDVPAGAALELQPGGKHVMLLGLSQTATTVPMELQFRDAGTVLIEVELLPEGAEL